MSSESPWSPGEWKITLDFGIEEASDNSLLGDGWGDGGRLVLSFEAVASADVGKQPEDANAVEMRWLGGKPTGTIECINGEEEYCTSYINTDGQQHVQISPGRWRIEPPLPLLPTYATALPGQASTLRFYLRLLTAIERNAISFPEDQLLLLQSNAFRASAYEEGIQTIRPFQYAKERSQRELEEQLNHETGDRRLDGSDLLETLGGYKDAAELVIERDERRRMWKEIENVLPKVDSSVDADRRVVVATLLEDEERWGVFPGDTEPMTIERGIILAVAAKPSNQNFFSSWMQDSAAEEPIVVGKWTATPIFDEDLN
ncbi:hypothetical protein ACHAXT_012055 [Thalassiosira profunda]